MAKARRRECRRVARYPDSQVAARRRQPLSRQQLARMTRLCLRDGHGWQRVLGHAQRSVVRHAGHSWNRPVSVVARIAELGRRNACVFGCAGQAAAYDAKRRTCDSSRWQPDAARHARRRCADAGGFAGVPQHERVRDEPAAGGRGATLRVIELPRLLRAAQLLARIAVCGKPRAAVRSRRPRRARPRGRTGPSSCGAPARCAFFARIAAEA